MSVNPLYAKQVAEAAVKKAVEFWQLPSEWAISVVITSDPEEANPASIHCQHDYMIYKVHINPNGYDQLADIWRDAGGHEVGHLVMEEALSLQELLTTAKDRHAIELLRSLERGNMRLEQMFVRCCPYPGNEQFVESG